MQRLRLALALPLLLVVIQQQLLQRLPPRLERLRTAAASSGPASLQVRFSRPMDRASLQRSSRLDPPLEHRWHGGGDTLLLGLDAGQRLRGPLTLRLAGHDRRGLPLAASRWRWDPRPRILAVVPTEAGERLQLRGHDGRWRSLAPAWSRIHQIEALGDGSGVAVVAEASAGRVQVWRIPLQQRNLARAPDGLAGVRAGRPRPLLAQPGIYAHLSSNRRGELLVQSGGMDPGSERVSFWTGPRRSRRLPLQASGPMRLLPEGGAVIVPHGEGLQLQTLPPRAPQQQILPGSRDLSAFCPQAGRALLLRHWPDFRRSLELVEPGRPPRQLWIGPEALVASACDRGGERIWGLLVGGVGRPLLTLIALDRSGRVLARRRLQGWEPEPGSGLHYDPAGDRLLAVLRRQGGSGEDTAAAAGAELVLLDAASLEPRPLGRAARQALWLPPG